MLKKNGGDYNAIINELKTQFLYSKNIIRGIIIDVENEAKAILDNPKSAVKSGYSFKYPKNWKISPLDEDLDEDKFFTIEGSYSGIMMFSIFDGKLDDFPSLSEINEDIGNEYKDFQIKDKVNSWGEFKGEGNKFHAISMNNPCLGNIFRYTNNTHAFYVAYLSMEDDYNNVREGFQLIETTLKLENE
jgi:hypothetical protein